MDFKLEKPNLSEIKDSEMIKAVIDKKTEILDFVKRVSGDSYLYWDKIRYEEPSPKNISKDLLWKIVKFFREGRNKTIILDKDNKYFTWKKLDYFEEFFHEVDLNTGGELFTDEGRINRANKQKLITRGIMEEAIASSQLEGAVTSRKIAKELIREGRGPKNESEQMIVNSHEAMKKIEEEYKNKEISLNLILELHKITTKNTLDSNGESPRLRTDRDKIYVSDSLDGTVYHEGPRASFVDRELKKLIDFFNDKIESKEFMHPIIKAIMIHFWIGYLHPFTDGNGRLARLLFYWYLLKKNYWGFIYLPVSRTIKESSKQYRMAYIYSEQDDNDLTYFIDYNIKKIKISLNDFKKYLDKQTKENNQMGEKCKEKYGLNQRQIYSLQFLYGNPEGKTSLRVHTNINQVSKMTANRDLKDLENKEFITPIRQGRNVYYYGTPKIRELFGK